MKRRITGLIIVVAAAAAAVVVALSGSPAGARTARQLVTTPLLALPTGDFEIALGTPPEWLPLSGTAQTLTVIGGAPEVRNPTRENVYVGFTTARASCAATPATSRAVFHTFAGFYSSAHSAAKHAGVFAPNGGAPKSTYLASRAKVVVHQTGSARTCVWLATNTGPTTTKIVTVKKVKTVRIGKKKKKKTVTTKKTVIVKAPRSLVSTSMIALENNTFAASVSNLTGAVAGTGGYDMYAIDGGHAFRYKVSTNQCGLVANDAAATVTAGTPASESVAIAKSPCATDASRFTFSGANVSRTLSYLVSDALASPTKTIAVGGCELDPLTELDLQDAETYLQAVGCRVGRIEITPYESTLTRGNVAWASMNGAIAEIAPAKSTVDLVLNGLPPTQPAKKSR